MRAILDGPIPQWLPGDSLYRERAWGEVQHAYRDHDGQLIWIHKGVASDRAHELATALRRAPLDGLDPAAYGELAIRQALAAPPARQFTVSAPDAERLADLDVRLTTAFVRFVRERHDGCLPLAVLDPDWCALRDTVDVTDALARTLRSPSSHQPIAGRVRIDSAYVKLQGAIRRYRPIVARGGWPPIPARTAPKVGEEDPRCPALRRLLVTTGDLPDTIGDTRYDAGLARGVRRFQSRHGIAPTGRLDPPTLKALNVPAAERLRTLELNLERLRWMPAKWPDPIIRVNIPDSRLRVVSGGVDSLTMRVVVGSRSTPTPVFSDIVTYIEFQPTWGVPKQILIKELLPSFRRNPDYFRENQMRIMYVAGADPVEVAPDSVPWEHVEDDSFPFFVRQDAGVENPLGHVKFMCPNEYDVYLHDTSSRGHFAAQSRFLSHGCVRVQKPTALAIYLLRGTTVAAPDSVDSLMVGLSRRLVGLKRRVPVLFEYCTSWVDDAGAIQFRPDVYELDQRLDVALRSGHTSDFDINPAVSRNPRMSTNAQWGTLSLRR